MVTINKKQKALIISTYKNVALAAKLKVDKLEKALAEAKRELETADAITKHITGKYASWQLITDRLVETDTVDKTTGKAVRKRVYDIIPEKWKVSKTNKSGEPIEWVIVDEDEVLPSESEITDSVILPSEEVSESSEESKTFNPEF